MSTVLVSQEGSLAIVTLNRPEKLNALNAELLQELFNTFESLSQSSNVRAAILTGAGEKAFAAGADIAAMSNMTPGEAKRFAEVGHRVGAAIENARFPVIAAVNGFALGGGCEIALACDFIYASDKAKFGQPEVNLGVIPGFGGTQRLLRRIGIGRARELCFTGEIIGAEEALRIGLANVVVPAAELLDRAKKTANLITQKGPLAIASAKRVFNHGEGVPLAIANEIEALGFANLFGSLDQKEGMTAFVEKRVASFQGK